MQSVDIIRKLMTDKGLTQGDITVKLGMKSQSGVSQALKRDMKITMLLRFLDVLDCDLVIKERNGDKEYIVEGESD